MEFQDGDRVRIVTSDKVTVGPTLVVIDSEATAVHRFKCLWPETGRTKYLFGDMLTKDTGSYRIPRTRSYPPVDPTKQ